MTEPTRLTGTVYTSLDAYRAREDGHEESFEVTENEAAELLLSVEPVPNFPPDPCRSKGAGAAVAVTSSREVAATS